MIYQGKSVLETKQPSLHMVPQGDAPKSTNVTEDTADFFIHATEDVARQYIAEKINQREPLSALYEAMARARDAWIKQGDLARALADFDRLQSCLIDELQSQWHERVQDIQARLVSESQAHLISDACNQWMKEGHIELYNFCDEMPVMASVRLLSAQKDALHIDCDEDLIWVIAAGEQRRTAFARIPASDLSLRMTVAAVHGSHVTLAYGGIIHHEQEKRKHVRVRCLKPARIALRRDKGPWWYAVIHDFSESGLGLSSRETLPWKKGEACFYRFSMCEHVFDGRGTVQWREQVGDQVRLGMQMKPSAAQMKLLQHEVAMRARAIQAHLKIGGLPDSLAGLTLLKSHPEGHP